MGKTILEKIVATDNNFVSISDNRERITGKSFTIKEPSENIPIVSIIIPMWNTRNTILRCLTAIEQNSFNISNSTKLEVILVDDGSEDGIKNYLKNNCFLNLNVKFISQKHSGLAKARNTGFSASSGKIIISIDSDILLNKYALENMVFHQMGRKNCVFVGFRSDINGESEIANVNSIKLNGIGAYGLSGDLRLNYPTIYGHSENMCLMSQDFLKLGFNNGILMPLEDDPWTLPDMLFGAIYSCTRDTYKEVQGYDERFFGWGKEDGFFAAKLISSNKYIVPLYSAFGFHIFHKPRSKNKQLEYEKNNKLYKLLIKNIQVNSYPKYLDNSKSRIQDVFEIRPKKSSRHYSEHKSHKYNITLSTEDLVSLGKYNQVIDSLSQKKFCDLTKKDKLLYSQSLNGAGMHSKAEMILKELVKTNGLFQKNIIELMNTYLLQHKYDEAHKLLKKANKNNRKFCYYWTKIPKEDHFRRAKYYFSQGFYEKSIECCGAILINDPKNKDATMLINKILKHKNES